VFYLPWARIGRVLFLYHYMSSYLFALLLTGFWLSQAFIEPKHRPLLGAMLAVTVVIGLLFAPIWIGYPITQHWFDRLMWFRSWI
jgi:dolichyl-phosphate-mannose-protein mannosyltransferase